MQYTFSEIRKSLLFQNALKKFFGNLDEDNFETVTRPACFFVRIKHEGNKINKRVIIFPPNGFTGDKVDLLNPHPDTRKAKVKILGKIDPTKKGFKPLLDEVQLIFSTTSNLPTETSFAYGRFSKKHCQTLRKSWKNWFYVVKQNGWGYFHSLVNLSTDWVVALLEKELTDQKNINNEAYLKKLPHADAQKLQGFLKTINLVGDQIFKNQTITAKILKFPPKILVPILIQMLNVQETGKHENCTYFALLLKIAKKNKSLVLVEIKKAIKLKLAPYYYLEDLKKIT